MQYSAQMQGESSSFLTHLAKKIRELRLARKKTSAAVAKASDLSLRFYAQLEAGTANIAVSRLNKVATALDISLSELFKQLEEEQNTNRSIALLGLRGAGKSCLGSQLAEKLGMAFIEMDEVIETKAGLNLTEIFSLHGEQYYRRLESSCLDEFFAQSTPAVLALSGGIVNNEISFSSLQNHCTTVWLKASPEDHMSRVQSQGDLRPMANHGNAMLELKLILDEREPFYKQADVTVNTSQGDENQSLKELLNSLSVLGYSAQV